MPKGEQVNLQRTLTFVSVFYFTYSASKACLFPFLTLYFRQLGLSATQTGVICGLKACVAFWAAPLWSSFATQHGRQRIILMGAIFMMLASNLGLTLLPPADGDLYLAFCNPGNKSADQGTLNNTRIDDDNVRRTPTVQTPLISTVVHSSTPSGNQNSTPSAPSINSVHPTFPKINLDIGTEKTTGNIFTKPTTQQFKPFNNWHPKPSHEMYSTATSAHKNSEAHNSIPKPSHFLPESNSQYTEESTAEDWSEPFLPNNGQSPDDEYQESTLNSVWSDAIRTPSILPWKLVQQESNDKRVNQKSNVFNWGNVKQEQTTENKNSNSNNKLAQDLHKISTSTRNFDDKHSSATGHHSRKERSNIDRHSVSMETAENSQNDQFPRSLGSVQDSLSKTVGSFLELEHITFIIALLIVVVGESLSCPVDKICDSNLHETLDAVDELDKYKRHRVPSLIGFGIFALVVTLIVDNTDCRIFLQASHFMIHFYLFACLLGLAFLLAIFYPIPMSRKGNRQMRFCKGLRLLFADPHNAVVTLTMVITGTLASNIHTFLFWHVQDLGGSEVVMGVTVLVSVVSHIPMLFLTGWVTRKLGQTGILVVILLCLATRLLYFAFLWTPWAVVPVEVLCAFSQQALWETVTAYAEQISPPAMDRSTQSILNSLYHGLGFAIGTSIGGLVYDQAGLKILYGSSAGVALLWGVVVILVGRFVPKKRKLHYSSLLRREEEGEEDYLSDEDSDEVYGNDWLVKALKDDL